MSSIKGVIKRLWLGFSPLHAIDDLPVQWFKIVLLVFTVHCISSTCNHGGIKISWFLEVQVPKLACACACV